jgi:hypothetical protein
MNQAAVDAAHAPDDPGEVALASLAPAPASALGWRRMLRFLPAISAMVATCWMFRSVLFHGMLPGNIADARWTIALHEHWYRVWVGQESIRDLHYYFPLPDMLGTSDAFFVQGQIYSLLRFLGIGQVNSWVIACFVSFLAGALGVAVLSRHLLRSVWIQASFVVLCTACYPVEVGFEHVQLYGLLAVSWVFVGLYDLVSRRHVRRGFILLTLAPPLLALSSWYAMVLMAIVLAFLGLSVVIFSTGGGIARTAKHLAVDIGHVLRSPLGVGLVFLSAALWAAVLWIYVPGRGLLPPSEWSEVTYYSPRWSDLWNAAGGGGGIWSWLYTRIPGFYESTIEIQRGFTPIVFLAFVVAGLMLIRTAALGRGARRVASGTVGRPGLLAGALSVVLVLAFFLVDDRGLSFYRLAWFHVPGLESIRAPFRVMLIVYGIAFFVILGSLELAWQRAEWLRSVPWRRTASVVCTGVLVLAMFAEMLRTLDAHWTRADLLSPALLAQIPAAQAACDSVILLDEDPSDPVWVNPIDAVVFATLSGLPTPQGYSRADPIGYPGPVGMDGTALAQWMRGRGFDGRICSVSAHEVRVLPD